MRPDLIGERCTAGALSGQLVMWESLESGLQGLILLDDGTLELAGWRALQFPQRTEQPDELREAAEALLTMAEAAHAGTEFASDGVVVDAMARLRKALEQ